MISSTAKYLLICIASLFYLSACGSPVGSGGSSDTSTSSTKLSAPTVQVVRESGKFKLKWDDSGASQYRVLYWQGTDAPDESTTAGTAYTLPPLSRGDYTVIVEAYNALGSSMFSAPVAVEVV
jgi:hypothetical protein